MNRPVLGTMDDFRMALGGKCKRKGKIEFRVGAKYATAVKVASGFKGRRLWPIQQSVDWVNDPANKDFTQSSVYPKRSPKRSPRDRRAARGSKSNE